MLVCPQPAERCRVQWRRRWGPLTGRRREERGLFGAGEAVGSACAAPARREREATLALPRSPSLSGLTRWERNERIPSDELRPGAPKMILREDEEEDLPLVSSWQPGPNLFPWRLCRRRMLLVTALKRRAACVPAAPHCQHSRPGCPAPLAPRLPGLASHCHACIALCRRRAWGTATCSASGGSLARSCPSGSVTLPGASVSGRRGGGAALCARQYEGGTRAGCVDTRSTPHAVGAGALVCAGVWWSVPHTYPNATTCPRTYLLTNRTFAPSPRPQSPAPRRRRSC